MDAGGMVAEGVVRAGRFGGSAREGGGRALPPYPYGWWLRAQVSRDAPPPLPPQELLENATVAIAARVGRAAPPHAYT